MTNPDSDPLVGRTVGQYQILARIGGGGMGVVYSARAARLGRIVALKFLPPQWSHDASAKDRFVREAQAASATNHPNICTIHDIETADDGQLFIVMAYYDGETLKKRLESGPLPIEEALDVATQVADGLAKAHAQSVVHRDIKPGNLILTEDGVRILDFGLATFADALKLTAENAALGTVAYMSPEQVRGQLADARTDVWAAGAVLYETLTGHPPFRGSHAEAIGYAVRNEQPTPIRAERPEVAEEVEQLVFRALHKEPSVRYASGRELARALRQVRGLSVPLDLRTQPIAVEAGRAPRRPRIATKVSSMTVLVLVAALLAWIWWPADPVLVAVAPVVNQTGYPELDDFGLALTHELARQLGDVGNIRVLPYLRMLEIIRPFRAERRYVSREALQAIATHSGAQLLIVPTVLRESQGWQVRVEFRRPDTGAVQGAYVTSPDPAALMKKVVYRQIGELPPAVFAHIEAHGPRGATLVRTLRAWLRRPPSTAKPRMGSLDAARSFEEGIDAYEQLEYATAGNAFDRAMELDPRNPTPAAWKSRVAVLMRQDKIALESGDRARRLVTSETPADEAAFVDAVAAEAHRDVDAASARYRALESRHAGESFWLIELGGFQDRQGLTKEAVETYHRALVADDRLVKPRVELCRMYSPSRLNEPALARQQGERGLAMYVALGNRGGEAQARWCLTDVLLAGESAQRREARQHAESALAIMKGLGYRFGIARGYNYLANVAHHERNAAEAAALWEQTLAAAREVGFVVLESRTLMNLGVANEALGKRPAALKYYRDSFAMAEALGAGQDAAWIESNIAALLIDYGGDQEEGLRHAQNALAALTDLHDKDFEVFTRRVIAMYHRYRGQHEEAVRELTRARELAREHNLDEKVTQLDLDMARLQFDVNDYVAAEMLLQRVEPRTSGRDRIHARTELARTRARLGAFDLARADLAAAAHEVTDIQDAGSLPLLRAAEGEVAFEAGLLRDARVHFAEAAAFGTDGDLLDAASVEARAYAGFIDATLGAVERGRREVLASLERARRMHRASIEARCLLFLARIDVAGRRFDDALSTLAQIPETIGDLELRAQTEVWRGRALMGRGDQTAAAAAREKADRTVSALRSRLSDSTWVRVLLRPEIRLLTGESSGAGGLTSRRGPHGR